MEINPQYTYLLLNTGTLLFPLALSFDKKVAFFRSWKALFPAIAITGLVFIIWDVWFTQIGVWSFNPEFVTGVYMLGLPIEEWLFFFTVPYACVFIYECLNSYIQKDILEKWAQPITLLLAASLILVGSLHLSQLYTSITFLSLATWLLLSAQVWRAQYMGRFFLAFLVCLIPFSLINGVLTAMPVVIYNNAQNLAIRMGTIPVEDTFYLMLLLLMNVSIYELLKYYFSRNQLRGGESHV